MPKGEVVPVPILCSVTFGAPIRVEPGEERRAWSARGRCGSPCATMNQFLRSLTLAAGRRPVHRGVRPAGARQRGHGPADAARAAQRTRDLATELQDFRQLLAAPGAWWSCSGSRGRAAKPGDAAVRADRLLRAARVHHAVADPPRRPPQPGAGLLPVLPLQFWLVATRHSTCSPCSSRCTCSWPSRWRARSPATAPLPGAQRQAAVGHHGLRLRHEPRAGAAAAGVPRPQLRGQAGLPRVLPGDRGADLHAGAALVSRRLRRPPSLASAAASTGTTGAGA